jgi:hypothetical protein
MEEIQKGIRAIVDTAVTMPWGRRMEPFVHYNELLRRGVETYLGRGLLVARDRAEAMLFLEYLDVRLYRTISPRFTLIHAVLRIGFGPWFTGDLTNVVLLFIADGDTLHCVEIDTFHFDEQATPQKLEYGVSISKRDPRKEEEGWDIMVTGSLRPKFAEYFPNTKLSSRRQVIRRRVQSLLVEETHADLVSTQQ